MEADKGTITIDTSEDLITLSVTLQRMQRTNHNLNYIELTHPSVAESVTDIDRAKADKIRDYYQKKFLYLTLQGQHITKWRKDLQSLLSNSTNKYTENFLGMAYKLPYFYAYDIEIDEIFISVYAKVENQERSGLKCLKFIRKIPNEQKHERSIEYWFTDNNGDKYMMFFSKDNLLIPLFDKLVDEGNININGTYIKRRKDNREFFIASKYSFND